MVRTMKNHWKLWPIQEPINRIQWIIIVQTNGIIYLLTLETILTTVIFPVMSTITFLQDLTIKFKDLKDISSHLFSLSHFFADTFLLVI